MNLLNLLTNFRWNYRSALALVALGIVVVCCSCMLLSGSFFGTGSDTVDEPRVDNRDNDEEIPPPVVGNDDNETVNENFDLGNLVAASSIDRDGCPTEATRTFDGSDTIYIATDGSRIPQGTQVFVRLFQGNEILEDADQIEAPEDFDDVCVSFVFERLDGDSFAPGEYEAQIFVNGASTDSVTFSVE